MLKDYKNKDVILQSTEPIRGDRYSEKDLLVLKYTNTSPTFDINKGEIIELHVYDEDGNYIISNHNAKYKIEKPKSSIERGSTRNYYFDIHNAIRDLGLLGGNYKFTLNFYRSIVGSFSGKKMALTEISPSRKEIRLKPVDDFKYYERGFNELKNIGDVDFLVNFGNDIVATGVNYFIDDRSEDEITIVVKLYDKLSDNINLQDQAWVVDEVSLPYIDNIKIAGADTVIAPSNIKGPNFDVDTRYSLNTETDFKTWNQLLGSGVTTSQQIIDNYFSGSLSGIKLNIDYCEFDNFVHFSSAGERVKNFKYKLQLIEQYDSRLGVLNSSTGSLGENVNVTTKKRNEVISGFDDFENYLYFQSGSLKYTYGSCSIDPWPKTDYSRLTPSTWQEAVTKWNQINTAWSQGGSLQTGLPPEKPYTLYHTTSSVADTYYKNLIATASLFDRDNDNRLVKTIPAHIRNDSSNDQYELFVNMMGHHFDILWTYVKHLNKIITREEHPHDGMSNDLLFNVAKSMGWNLTIGDNTTDLWKYTLGTNQDGTAQSTGSLASESQENVTKEIWRRIVNNLPYMLKTKGTARSVKALLSCYGIPQTMLAIREYGGPKLPIGTKKPVFVKDDFSYALRANNGQYIRSAWLPVKTGSYKVPDTLELRFRTKDGLKESVNGVTIFQAGFGPRPEWYVTAVPSGSNKQKGNLNFYLSGSGGYKSASINDEYLFDGNWAGLMVRRDTGTDITGSDNSYTMFIKKHKYNKLTTDVTASISITGATEYSYNHSWKRPDLHGTETIPKIHYGWGDNPAGISHFSGSYQEIRYWSRPLDEEDFANHVTSPSAYDGNNITSSFEQLKFRIPLRQKFDIAITSSLKSQHPDQSITEFTSSWITSASFHNFSGSTDFYGIDETYYIENPSIGGNNLWSDKIRIESSTLTGVLNTKTRKEKSTYDTSPVDSPRLGIYFSPQNSINEDIFNQLGFWEVDDYIGAPDNVYKDSYPGLKALAWDYWKKYDDRNNYNDYLRMIYQYDMSLFKQIEQLLPARAKKLDGILIEPNILERSKDVVLRKPTWTTPYYTMSYDTDQTEFSLSSSYYLHTGSLSLLEDKNVSSSYENLPGVLIPLGLSVSASRYKFEETLVVQNLNSTGFKYATKATQIPFTSSGWFDDNTYAPSYSRSVWNQPGASTGAPDAGIANFNNFHSTAANRPGGGDLTPILGLYNYDFNIPRDATIVGIEAQINKEQVVTGSSGGAYSGSLGFVKDYDIWVDTNASASRRVGENKAYTSYTWSYEVVHNTAPGGGAAAADSFETRSYGGSGQDRWGQSLTPIDINSGSFGVKIVAFGAADNDPFAYRRAFVDAVGLNIYYTIKEYVTASNPYWQYEPMQPCITGSRLAEQTYIDTDTYKTYATDWMPARKSLTYVRPGTAVSWSNAQNITGSSNGIFATASVSSSLKVNNPVTWSSWIVGYDYGHDVPSASIVTGVIARVRRKASNAEPNQLSTPSTSSYIGISDVTASLTKYGPYYNNVTSSANEARLAVFTPGTGHIRTEFRSTGSSGGSSWGTVGTYSSRSIVNPNAGGAGSMQGWWSGSAGVTIKTLGTTGGIYGNVSSFANEIGFWTASIGSTSKPAMPYIYLNDFGFSIPTEYTITKVTVAFSGSAEKLGTRYKNGGDDPSLINKIGPRTLYLSTGSFSGGADHGTIMAALSGARSDNANFTNSVQHNNPTDNNSRSSYFSGSCRPWGSGGSPRQVSTVMITGSGGSPIGTSDNALWNTTYTGFNLTPDKVNASTFGTVYAPFWYTGDPDADNAHAIGGFEVQVYAFSSSFANGSGSVTNTWYTQSSYAGYGSSNQLWNHTWSPAEARHSSMSFHFQANFPTGSENTGSIDTIETKVFYKTTSSLELSTIQEFLPRGIENHRYAGCKVTSADWNVDSPDTVDGGPVVEIKKSNPNKFIVSSGGASGSIQVL